jgi:hypothetical protein
VKAVESDRGKIINARRCPPIILAVTLGGKAWRIGDGLIMFVGAKRQSDANFERQALPPRLEKESR